jgi:hypothetical protein
LTLTIPCDVIAKPSPQEAIMLRATAFTLPILLWSASSVLAGSFLRLDNIIEGHPTFFEFGLEPISASIPSFTSCAPQPCTSPSLRNVTMVITSGPLLDLTVLNESDTRYRYAPGAVQFIAEWDWPDGSTGTGGFLARVRGFSFVVEGENIEGNTDYPFSYPLNGFDTGPGQLDADLARYLGAARRTGPPDLGWVLENIQGDPTTRVREVGHIRYVTLEVPLREVPEPTLAGLALIAAAVTAARHRRKPKART